MNCTTCARWKLKGAPLAKHGFGRCELGPEWRSTGPLKTCDRHKPAHAEVIAPRVKWLKAMGLDIDKEK